MRRPVRRCPDCGRLVNWSLNDACPYCDTARERVVDTTGGEPA